ncbi:MAG: Pseudogene of N-6 DNA methylase [Methanobrevibacter sp. CfCl-M3]
MIKNNLLKLNTNKKYQKNIKILYNHKEALLEWYKKYEAKQFDDNNNENLLWFQKVILKDLLGYKFNVDMKFNYPLNGSNVEFMIMKDNEPYIPVIVKTTGVNLDSLVEEAFDCANKGESIEWFIISNYNNIRLYNIKSFDNYIEFNVEDIYNDNSILKDFLLCFSKESMLEKDIISKLYVKDLSNIEYDFENQFCKLYNQTRLMLIKELQYSNNISLDEAVTYAQLIINRYIFACFRECKDLLPENITSMTLLSPVKTSDVRRTELWYRLNELFFDLSDENPEIGLFKEDLSHLVIRDTTQPDFYDDIEISYNFPEQAYIIDNELKKYPLINKIYSNLLIISSFDYTDIDVNIKIIEKSKSI